MYASVHMYVCVYICISVYDCVCAYVFMCMYMSVYVYLNACVCMSMMVYVCMCVCAYVGIRVCVHVAMYACNTMYVCGKVTGARLAAAAVMREDNKYARTEWRKKPGSLGWVWIGGCGLIVILCSCIYHTHYIVYCADIFIMYIT